MQNDKVVEQRKTDIEIEQLQCDIKALLMEIKRDRVKAE